MGNKKIVFFSDVHIGINSTTNWFQESVHAPYLEKMLGYVRENKDSIREMIILGDLLDQWMYPPTVKPPTPRDITAANPRIFGGEVNGEQTPGALIETIDALDGAGGKTTYIPGNHDMGVTPADIAAISPKINANNGERVYTPGGCEGQLVCTHGNVFSLFNAQDYKSFPPNMKGLPVAHFISRLAARWSEQECKKTGKANSSQLPDTGDPEGLRFDAEALVGVFESILEDRHRLSQLILKALSDATGNVDDGFIMVDGSTVSLQDMENLYEGLFRGYPASTKTDDLNIKFGDFAEYLALLETDKSNDLDHFAKELAEDYPLIVMGHTHHHKLHYSEFWFHQKALYANSGFWCPSVPDMENSGRHPTFVEVEVEDGKFTTSLKRVVKKGGECVIEPEMGPMSIDMR